MHFENEFLCSQHKSTTQQTTTVVSTLRRDDDSDFDSSFFVWHLRRDGNRYEKSAFVFVAFSPRYGVSKTAIVANFAHTPLLHPSPSFAYIIYAIGKRIFGSTTQQSQRCLQSDGDSDFDFSSWRFFWRSPLCRWLVLWLIVVLIARSCWLLVGVPHLSLSAPCSCSCFDSASLLDLLCLAAFWCT